ncbi:3'-5' exonuclease [Alcaligenaceae bacterium SJ-26]|nr:3'-5' exonuclease [Alcaligenaceae bacterium SJ-26]
MIPHLVFDLETIPDADGLRRLRDVQGLDDAAVVEQALVARREAVGHDFMPLHLHRIVAIGCVFRDDRGFQVRCLGEPGDSEAALISAFFKTIERYTPRLISWNGSGFDLSVLHYRSLIHGIAAPRYWDMGEDDRDFRYNNYISRYHTRHVDLMDVLAKYNGRANAPLDELAKLCGFPGKLGVDGSQVWPMWQQGAIDDIRAYCETDVANTWLVYTRFRLLRGEIDQTGYEQELAVVKEALAALPGSHWQEYLAAWAESAR